MKAIAWVPQCGSNNSVELPSTLLKDDFSLRDFEPLGWIKTQVLELPHLSLTEVTTQAKIMADHPEWGSSLICITTSFLWVQFLLHHIHLQLPDLNGVITILQTHL